MFRMIARTMVSRIATALIDLVVIALTSLALVELLRDIARPSHTEAKDIILDISVIMIGWGVALEERGAVREVFKLQGGNDDAWQHQIDEKCHGVGVMLLLFGLFSEIFVQMAALPKTVISTEPIADGLLAIGAAFLAGGLIILVRHVWVLLMMRPGR